MSDWNMALCFYNSLVCQLSLLLPKDVNGTLTCRQSRLIPTVFENMVRHRLCVPARFVVEQCCCCRCGQCIERSPSQQDQEVPMGKCLPPASACTPLHLTLALHLAVQLRVQPA